MNFQLPLFSLILIIIGAGVAALAWSRWKLRATRPTATPGALLLGCGAVWMLTNAAELASRDLNGAMLWHTIGYLGIAPISILWLVMSLQFAGYSQLLTRRRLLLISLIPTISLVVLLTNSTHHLFVASARLEFHESVAHLTSEPGPFMLMFYGYAYLIVMGGTYVLTHKMFRTPTFRWQGRVILLGVILTVGANVLDWSQLNPIPQIKLTPFALTIAIVLFIQVVIRLRRADIIPSARENVVQTILDAVLVLDTENRVIDMNPAAEILSGLTLNRVVGSVIDNVWPEWAKQMKTSAGGPVGRTEIRLGEEGQQRVFDVRSSELKDWRGHHVSRVLVLREITERAKAEERLRHSEEQFRALTEHSTDVTIIINPDGTIQYVSPSLERIFKRNRDEVVGKNSLEFIHPDDVNKLIKALSDPGSHEKANTAITARFHDKDGNWHTLECIGTNMLDHPAIQGIVVNARDVTEREAVAAALRQSEERYRLHFAFVNDVIYSLDPQFNITSVSPSVEGTLGYKPEELIGRSLANPDNLPFLSPDFFEKAVEETMRILSGERIKGAQYEFIARDGTQIIAEISGSPVYQDGQIIAAVSVARDITARVHAEEHLRSSLQEKEMLLKEVHHRVKNNLQIISSLLNLQSGNIDDPHILSHFQESQNRIRSMALIHERLYRSDDLVRVNFQEYLNDLTSHLLQSYRAQHDNVVLKISTFNIHFDIDTAIPCGLIINELVSNALKYAFPNTTAGTICIQARQVENNAYHLTVQDDGIGIPAHIDPTQSKTLGLQLVTNLTRQLKGTLSIHTQNGTLVTIIFPVSSHHRVEAS